MWYSKINLTDSKLIKKQETWANNSCFSASSRASCCRNPSNSLVRSSRDRLNLKRIKNYYIFGKNLPVFVFSGKNKPTERAVTWSTIIPSPSFLCFVRYWSKNEGRSLVGCPADFICFFVVLLFIPFCTVHCCCCCLNFIDEKRTILRGRLGVGSCCCCFLIFCYLQIQNSKRIWK